MSKPRVVIVAESLAGCGGIERSIPLIAAELLRLGVEVHVVLLSPGGATRLPDGARIWVRPPEHARLFRHAIWYRTVHAERSLRTLLDEIAPSEVWVRQVHLAYALRRIRQSCTIRYIAPAAHRSLFRVSFRGRLGFQRVMKASLLHGHDVLTHRALLRYESRVVASPNIDVIAFSKNVQAGLTGGRVVSRGVRVILPGVDRQRFFPQDPAAVAKLARSLGIAHGESVVVYVGRLEFEKNVDLLLMAFARVRNRRKILVLVGDGGRREVLRRLADSLGISDRVRFVGAQSDDLALYYSLGRVNVVPTLVEGFGQSHIEAMACGVPSLGLAGPGTNTASTEIIRDAQNGFLVNPPDVDELSASLERALSLPDAALENMRSGALATARAYDWSSFVRETLGLLPGQATSRPSTPRPAEHANE